MFSRLWECLGNIWNRAILWSALLLGLAHACAKFLVDLCELFWMECTDRTWFRHWEYASSSFQVAPVELIQSEVKFVANLFSRHAICISQASAFLEV
ncbi:hypothetical protein BJ741DRAFT_587322 [Chytriomyces cf. hyalinus JEL632]|nr:hypothetical protein BJ741DRAFT_587322 [Chytriomyces cf. hyalinus JEL632]